MPPVANFKEIDPELGMLNLSKGGAYPVQYALRLAAGFGSQISMSLLHWVKTKDGIRRAPNALGYEYRILDEPVWKEWLRGISGSAVAEIEVEKRTLRVRDQAISARQSKAEVIESKQNSRAPGTANIGTPPRKPVQSAHSPDTRGNNLPIPFTRFSEPGPLPDDSLQEHIINIVSHVTGYPADMLDLNARLESDLGVDSIKQAEAFAAVSEAFGIEPDETLRLSNFPRLADVKEYVQDRLPAKVPTGAAVAALKFSNAPDSPVVKNSVAAQSGPSVKDSLIALVVEKTGYPKEMLDMDLDLEADLGIDTVKQAELFAAIRQNYDIPRDQDLKLRDFPTLAHVLKFVYEKRPELAGIDAESAQTDIASDTIPPEPETAQKATAEQPAKEPQYCVSSVPERMPAEIKEKVLQIVAEKTGYPPDMLDLDLDLEADLGIDTVKQAEMFAAIRSAFSIPRDQNLKLRDFPTFGPRDPVCRGASAGCGAGCFRKGSYNPLPARVPPGSCSGCGSDQGAGASNRCRKDGISNRHAGSGLGS